MGKSWVEICLVSAHDLHRKSSLIKKHQCFAVGWIHPDSKYCTKIDSTGTRNPVWGTKFSTSIDTCDLEPLLHVEVYSIEPVFLRQNLMGNTTVVLKEFLDKQYNMIKSEVSRTVVEEVGRFELRKKKSSKSRGFVDVSIRISSQEKEEEHGGSSNPGGKDGLKFNLMDHSDITNMAGKYGSLQSHSHSRPNLPLNTTPQQPPLDFFPYDSHHPTAGGPSHPPPPFTAGYVPTFFPGPRVGHGSGASVNEGALAAAGAMIFGDDFMSGFDFHLGST